MNNSTTTVENFTEELIEKELTSSNAGLCSLKIIYMVPLPDTFGFDYHASARRNILNKTTLEEKYDIEIKQVKLLALDTIMTCEAELSIKRRS